MLKIRRIQLGKQAYRRLLKRVLERDGWRCPKCGSLKDLQVHHQKYRSQRKDDSLATSLPCMRTVTWKSTRSTELFQGGGKTELSAKAQGSFEGNTD
jgi:hypothetical protein